MKLLKLLSQHLKSSFYILIAQFLRFLRKDYIFYELLCNRDSKNLRKYYSVEYPLKNHKEKLVILMFDGKTFPVGLADRIRCITTLYQWCKNNNKIFKVYFIHPFNLEKYLIPNNYDWSITLDKLSFNINETLSISFSSMAYLFKERNVHYQEKYADKMLMKDFAQIHVYSNVFFYDDYFFDLYHELFKPSYYLNEKINEEFVKISGPYISISFRFARLLGDLDDVFGNVLPNNDQEILINKCIKEIINIKNENNNIKTFLITSDSNKFISKVKSKLEFIYVLDGKIEHIAFGKSYNSELRTFLDLYLISKAKKAYLVRTLKMYKSGFAQRAAMIGNIPFEEVIVT